jgi:hypothetical protein
MSTVKITCCADHQDGFAQERFPPEENHELNSTGMWNRVIGAE